MDNFMVAILVLLASSFGGRMINKKATELLNDNQKAQLVTLFSKSGKYNFGILIVALGLFFANLKFNWINLGVASFTFAVFVLTFLVIAGYGNHKKLKEHNFPEPYIKKNIFSTAIRFVGMVLFFLILEFWK